MKSPTSAASHTAEAVARETLDHAREIPPVGGMSYRSGALSRLVGVLCLCLVAGVQADQREIVVYPGYGGSRVVIEGRVIEARGGSTEAAGDSWITNLWRTARRLVSDEQEDVAVNVRFEGRTFRAATDEEGYFRVEADLPAGSPAGWRSVEAATGNGDARAKGKVLVVPADNRLGIISDIDDTILISEVTDKSRLLRNLLLVNYVQRQAVPGTAAFYARLAGRNPKPEAAPVFYLSASPRQLQGGIQTFLDRNGFPPGVLITKKVTNDETSDPLLDQVRYKTGRIEQLLAALPQVRFVLVGDDGEKDPEIYDEIRRRYPDRIEAIWIRKAADVVPRPTYPGQRDLAEALGGAGRERGGHRNQHAFWLPPVAPEPNQRTARSSLLGSRPILTRRASWRPAALC
ncbi:phosphatase domain-containing protein [Sulfurifustis variabilis]|nr:phosphatase domain-containing protein [Sulfurifustis variabilis]